jgi:pimeloyl-ACP methyl ester carboxylesterase
VAAQPWIVFRPNAATTTGLIFYPGGLVAAEAYAPALRAVAERGFLVVVPPMPLKLAVFAPERAAEIQAAFPAVRHWAVGGHSLGGAMAARYAARHAGAVEGVVLWASYPDPSDSLVQSGLAVVSIYGTRDGVATPTEVEAARGLLPAGTRWVSVEGGNHAQFGWYGEQRGDLPATIDRAAQQRQVVEATVDLLRALEAR